MRVVVVIATAGRKAILSRTLKYLERQTRLPDEILISASDPLDVEPYEGSILKVTSIFGTKGLTSQRNRALEQVLPNADIVTFFDDDFLPARDYLQLLEAAFETNPDWAVVMGSLVQDGIHGPGLDFTEGVAILQQAENAERVAPRAQERFGAYGCNMSVRAKCVGTLRFDERLPLYGWQEDIDFTNQLRRRGRVVMVSNLLGVHLGARISRVSGLRFGYSQVVNPLYLLRKGTMPAGYALGLILRNIAANALKSVRPEDWIDRRGRMKGNIIAAMHVLRGRVEPEYILNL